MISENSGDICSARAKWSRAQDFFASSVVHQRSKRLIKLAIGKRFSAVGKLVECEGAGAFVHIDKKHRASVPLLRLLLAAGFAAVVVLLKSRSSEP